MGVSAKLRLFLEFLSNFCTLVYVRGFRFLRFLKISEDLQLDVIIETHDEEEVGRAMKLNYPIIGINNRNLKNLKTDVNNSVNLFTSISKDFTVIAESGIKSSLDIAMYNELGIFNFLIGESILKSDGYSAFIKRLLNND